MSSEDRRNITFDDLSYDARSELEAIAQNEQRLNNHESRITKNEKQIIQIKAAAKTLAFVVGSGTAMTLITLLL